MFTVDTYIDTFQHTKKQLTKQVITDPVLYKAAINFIDSQTDFAKMLAKNTEVMTKYFIEAQTSMWFPKAGDKK